MVNKLFDMTRMTWSGQMSFLKTKVICSLQAEELALQTFLHVYSYFEKGLLEKCAGDNPEK